MVDEQERKPRTSTTIKSFIKIGDFLDSPETSSIHLFSNFKIYNNKLIGKGAFSKVYQCKNTLDLKTYAVKVISKSKVISNNVSLDVIKSEIQIHERIVYKDIVRLYSTHEDKNSFYLFLEYIKGTTLDKKIPKGLNEKEACMYFSQIVSAIYFCHTHRLVFRDVKLENFIVDDNSNVKLCDFGWCAEITKEHPKRNTICGSYKYMAPEMVKEQPYDYAIDIWALGILLYELIHGYSPFQSYDNNYEELIIQILKFNLVIKKEISRNCQDLLSNLLNPNHRQRITIKEVLNHPWFNDWIVPTSITQQFQTNQSEVKQDKMFYDIINVVEKKNQKGKKDKKGKKNKSMATYKKIEGKSIQDEYSSPKNKKNSIQTNKTIPLQFNEQDIVENEQSKVISPIDEEDFIKERVNTKKGIDKKVLSNDQLISLLDNLNGDYKAIEKDKETAIRKREYLDEEIIPAKKLNSQENAKRIFSSTNNSELPEKSMSGNNFNKRQANHIMSERNDHHDYYNHQIPRTLIVNSKDNNNELQATLNLFSMAEKLKEEGKKEIVKQQPTFWDKFISPFKCGQANEANDQ